MNLSVSFSLLLTFIELHPVIFENLGILLLSIFRLLKNSELKLQWQSGIVHSENNKDLKGQGHLETSGWLVTGSWYHQPVTLLASFRSAQEIQGSTGLQVIRLHRDSETFKASHVKHTDDKGLLYGLLQALLSEWNRKKRSRWRW